jgi:NAD+ diphosphatase
MNKMEKSTLNFFSYSNLDRVSEYRLDESWLSTQLASPYSLFLLLHHQKALVNQQHQLLLLPYSDILTLLPTHLYPFLLGIKEGKTYFCIDISSSLAEDWNDFGKFEELRAITPFISEQDANMIAQGRALAHWHKMNRFCGVCGNGTLIQESGYKILCPHCNTSFFPRTDSAIIVQITYQDQCLLVRQPQWERGRYANVAGFLEPAETLESAVRREVKEETSLIVSNIQYHSSQPWAFPASIMLGFTAEARHKEVVLDLTELEDFMWVTRDEMVQKIKHREISLPFRFSISFRLIEDWFDAGTNEVKLRQVLDSLLV